MIVVPHRAGLRRIEQHPGIHRRYVAVTKKLVIVLAVPCGVKSEAVLTEAAAYGNVTTSSFVPSCPVLKSGFANGKHLTRGPDLGLGKSLITTPFVARNPSLTPGRRSDT